jgi:hypothetical protein
MADDTILELSGATVIPLQRQQAPFPLSDSSEQLYLSLPIPVSSRCIRLLDLDASAHLDDNSESSPLTGSLRVADLSTAPSFASLSYVWGPKASPPHTITCQGCRLEVTEDCNQALRHIRKRFGAVTVWIDAICINQKDGNEKIDQIPLMKDIYSLAASGYIWLGIGTEESDQVMDFLEQRATQAASFSHENVDDDVLPLPCPVA